MADFVNNFTVFSTFQTKSTSRISQFSIHPDGKFEPGRKRKASWINCEFHYFHFHIKMGYYCGVIPFKLRFNKDAGHYQLAKVNILQKVEILICFILDLIICRKIIASRIAFQIICTSIWVLLLLYITYSLRSVWKEREQTHIIMHYFRMVEKCAAALLPFIYCKAVHCKFDKLQDMLEIISHHSLLYQHETFRRMVCYYVQIR